MGTLTFGAIASSVLSLLEPIAKLILKIVLLLVCLSAVVPILPDDPFKVSIVSISATWAQWSDLINWLIPVQLILTSFLFGVMCYMFYFIYKLVIKTAVGNLFITASQTDLYFDEWLI